MSAGAAPASGWGRIIDEIEETLIAVILGLMTLITFANVIARYVFNSNILWALETTVFLFFSSKFCAASGRACTPCQKISQPV